MNRFVLAPVVLTALSLGAAVGLASPAAAAPNTTPQKVCGSSYKTVNSAPVGSGGTVYLTYNASNGRNCVATIRSNPGTVMDMAAWIYIPATDAHDSDWGQYTSYAGPTYAYGKGYCVDWGGNIGNVHVQVSGSNCGALKEHRTTYIR
ncbi:spore-associated protein [Streptomyces sp. NPDC050549]|uniref:spore-associated protein n=1 Tax=Streptomyces sp. NPDC050549 TaxID=3155406 RepID=UPI003412ACBD